MECEFDGNLPVNFLDPSQVKICNSDGEEVLCKCGNPSENVIMGKESYVTRCNKCAGYEQESCKLVYKPPYDEWEEKIIKYMCENGWKLEQNTETLLGFGDIQGEFHWMRDYDKTTRKFVQYNGNKVVHIKVSNEKD